jgi:lipopolysaccharide transport system permease protein
MNPSATPSHHEAINIEAPRGLVPLNLRELWAARELIWFLLARDVKGRYRQMALGPLWMVINPLINTALFVVIFSVVAKIPTDGLPAPLFIYSAMVVWTFFSAALFSAANSLLGFRDLISKVYFPRLVTPLVGLGSALIDFVISFALLIAMMIYYGYVPGFTVLWLLPYLALAALTSLCVGLWFAAWIVHFRDVASILGYIVRFWMYACPVVYPASVVLEKAPWFHPYYQLNPMTTVIEGTRWSLLGTGENPWLRLLIPTAAVGALTLAAAYNFRRTERSIVDIA